MRLGRFLLLSLLLTPASAAAIDPGVAQGSLQVNGETIPLDHTCSNCAFWSAIAKSRRMSCTVWLISRSRSWQNSDRCTGS